MSGNPNAVEIGEIVVLGLANEYISVTNPGFGYALDTLQMSAYLANALAQMSPSTAYQNNGAPADSSRIMGIIPPDGAMYYKPDHHAKLGTPIDHRYFNNIVNYLRTSVGDVDRLAKFHNIYTNQDNPHFADFKDWAGGNKIEYFSYTLGRVIQAPAYEPAGNFFYGLLGILGGLTEEQLLGGALLMQEGRDWSSSPYDWTDSPEDHLHVKLGIDMAKQWLASGKSPFDFFVEGPTLSDTATTNPDIITGSDGIDEIAGGDGRDRLDGMGGNDQIYGQWGADLIMGGGGFDRIYGGDADDQVGGGAENDELWGEEGNDVLYGDEGRDTVYGGNGGDHLFGGQNEDELWGMDGRDVVYGGDNYDIVGGSDGEDYMDGGEGDDILIGDGGSLYLASNYSPNGHQFRSEGAGFADTVSGVGGNDYLYGGGGADYMHGGQGNDQITGHDGNDTLLGGAGFDSLDGAEGNDFINGDRGNDLIYGGSGNDELHFNAETGFDIVMDFAPGDRVIVDSGTYFTYQSSEGAVIHFGPDMGVRLQGWNLNQLPAGWISGGTNTTPGQGGPLNQTGSAGPDYMNGSGYDDYLHGGAGNDEIVGQGGNDTLRGGQGDDVVRGDSGADIVAGDRGNDQLYGGAGSDRFMTHSDANMDWIHDFNVAEGDRVWVEYGSYSLTQSGANTVVDFLNGSQTILLNVATWQLASDTVYGGTRVSGAASPLPSGQVLVSDQYGDSLAGGAGTDTITAGQGPDVLQGGAGADVFVFPNTPWNAGQVVDFQPGSDKIDLRGLYSASGYGGSNPVSEGYVKVEADGQGGSKVLYDTDGYGSGNTIQFLITTLTGVDPSNLAGSSWLV